MNHSPLLSICVPTFNRSRFLDRQIARLSQLLEIHGHWSQCEFLVSDNQSLDETPLVCKRWSASLVSQPFRVIRQSRNLGLVGNLEFCYRRALGRYVWLVGDDDPLDTGAVDYVLAQLASSNNLAILHLNHHCVCPDEKTVIHEAFYPWKTDQVSKSGILLFERALEHRLGGTYFITASIVDRLIALKAADAWPAGVKNLVWPMYINAYAAANGPLQISSRPFLDCVYHRGTWLKQSAKLYYHDEPEVFWRMQHLGYDPVLLHQLARRRFEAMNFRSAVAIIRRLVIPHPYLFLKSLEFRNSLRRSARNSRLVGRNLMTPDKPKWFTSDHDAKSQE